MGIRAKFVLIITILSLVATVVIGITSYQLSKQNAISEAKDKGEIIFNYIQASSSFFSVKQYPKVQELADDVFGDDPIFIPDIMSKYVVERKEFDNFAKSFGKGRYIYKQATKNPLHLPNKADEGELKIITYFNNSGSLEKEDEIVKGNKRFYYMARPVKVTQDFCLECHGDPAMASEQQKDEYGDSHGYNWKLGDTVGVSIVYVSISKALEDAKAAALKIFFVGVGCLLVTIICIWVFLDKSVVGPIIRLSGSAKDISIGKNLCDSVHSNAKDEIGGLANSIDRMRISVNKLLKRTCPPAKTGKKK